MKARCAATWILAGLLAASACAAEVWRTENGEQWEGKVSGVYGPLAVFSSKDGSRQVTVDSLDEPSLGRLADYLAAQSASTPPWSTSTSAMAKALRNRLQILDGEKLVAFDPGARREPEVYLVYFGALWCGPCVRFSPQLVEAYEQLMLTSAGRFELVFVSSDRDAREQLDYVRKVRMPWPVLKYSAVGGVSLIERWQGRGIPCLVALTREGDMIFHSYRGAEYLGPQHVLRQVMLLLQTMAEESVAAKRARHRLAVVQHVRAAGSGNAAPKPYLIAFDPRRNRTLEAKELTANLEIDAQGRVTSVTFEPKLDAVIEYQLSQEANAWLFLPPVENGKARGQRVQLPLRF